MSSTAGQTYIYINLRLFSCRGHISLLYSISSSYFSIYDVTWSRMRALRSLRSPVKKRGPKYESRLKKATTKRSNNITESTKQPSTKCLYNQKKAFIYP